MTFLFIACVLCAVIASAAPVLQWISGDTLAPEKSAPVLERTFSLPAAPSNAVFEIAVAGWCEVSVNDRKAGSDVLSPVTCQPDRRLSRVRFDVTELLGAGENRICVLLGNGWFNCFTLCSWKFAEAAWLAAPQIRGRLTVEGQTVLVTDGSWRAYDSPIVFNALRNGEWYDARLEGTRPHERAAKVEKYSPAGRESPEIAVPCREFETFEPVRTLRSPDGAEIYDFGANIAGWCEIEASGAPGAKLGPFRDLEFQGGVLTSALETEDGKVILLNIQGRQASALGVTCQELAEILYGMGCINAGNLDGGASADMFYNGEYVNICNTSGGPRPMPTTVLGMPFAGSEEGQG